MVSTLFWKGRGDKIFSAHNSFKVANSCLWCVKVPLCEKKLDNHVQWKKTGLCYISQSTRKIHLKIYGQELKKREV